MEIQNTAQPEEKKRSLGARIVVALGFSTVLAKLSLIGTAIDGAKLLRDEPSFGQKIKALFSKKLLIKMHEQGLENGGGMRGFAKTFKFTLIIGTIGSVTGAVIGWIRGGRIEHASDLIHHPIKSTKLIFGPKPKTPEAAEMAATPDTSSRWQEQVAKTQQTATPSL